MGGVTWCTLAAATAVAKAKPTILKEDTDKNKE